MADWSQLPQELLDVISKHLSTETDILRFRSVCATWRSSIHPFSSRFPILPHSGISETTWGFYLSKRTIFRVSPPDPDPSHLPWLIKVERDNPNKTHLMNPLTGSESIPVPPSFPRSLNLLNFRVSELGQEYALQYISYRPNANSINDSVTLYVEKVAFCHVGLDGFVLLTIHVSGKLAFLKNGDKTWNIINDLPSPYDDVLFYDGEFYGVDATGRTVVVECETMSLRVVAGSVFGGDKKFLVESGGELFMVDKYISENDYDFDDENDEYEDLECFMSERTVKLEVYKLDKDSYPELTEMQARAIFQAAVSMTNQGVTVIPEIMVPLVGTPQELRHQISVIRGVATNVFAEMGLTLEYKVGTMIEIPRAALIADEIAKEAEFFSFGTNDLTQMTFGYSRDDVGKFLQIYLSQGILQHDPFEVLDQKGVGQLIKMATEKGRAANPKLKVGICGEHGGEPSSVAFFDEVGLDYVSCSPFRVPIARLAAAHVAV